MEKPSEKFCISPFVELNINPNGGAKVCCAFGRFVEKDGRPMSVYEHSVDEIWNSEDLHATRKRMIDGKPEPLCSYCYKAEAAGHYSLRNNANDLWEKNAFYNPKMETIADFKARMSIIDYRTIPREHMLSLDMGNLCNLKCRMCHASASSMIANDPVHSKWSRVDPVAARWKGADLVFAPRPVLGITYSGFSALDRNSESDTIWSQGPSSFTFSAFPADCKSINLNVIVKAPLISLDILNGEEILSSGILPAGKHTIVIPVSFVANQSYVLNLNAALGDGQVFTGESLYGVERASCVRAATGKSDVAFSRFDNGQQWFQNTDFLIDELLAAPEHIKLLCLIGGEPLLIDQCKTIIRHLVDTGASKNIVLQFTTNGTILPDEWLELASKFRTVSITISADGFGPISEYIRFPSNWATIHENILRFKTLKNAHMVLNATVQAYNMLHVVDLIKYCDEIGLEFRYNVALGPAQLNPLVMPEEVRVEAAERVRRFAQRNDISGEVQSTHVGDKKAWLLQLANSFVVPQPHWTDKSLLEFMKFTNDLDDSRGQDFKKSIPDLYDLIVKAGYEWSNERKFSKGAR